MNFDVPTLFAVLGPLFLLLGTVQCMRARSLAGAGKTWLLIGLFFSAVALVLHSVRA